MNAEMTVQKALEWAEKALEQGVEVEDIGRVRRMADEAIGRENSVFWPLALMADALLYCKYGEGGPNWSPKMRDLEMDVRWAKAGMM